MNAQQHAKLVLLLDALQKQLGYLRTECAAAKVRLDGLRAQYAQVALTHTAPVSPAHSATLKKKCTEV
ncbi:hypothetical protein NHP190003_14450 [Helicobacter sp. NHP19-003]|uniref:Uncharacterized protein n=1 Tax=Helicobacter gastrocanis TaxID=2849641 RepID=A0ABN6I7U8_9HELI|nr:hypothetical protein [Helicobacter sp. NHP19-003]BCZ18163.1 hypothetical protein NHP190003_14450 [Helicobacter sp. NHP19-003]